MVKKKIIDGDRFVHGGKRGNYIRLELEDNSKVVGMQETIKISTCNDKDEFIITGKQLKQLQRFWKKDKTAPSKVQDK